MICDCTPPSAEELARGLQACGDDCLNRMLMIEWLVFSCSFVQYFSNGFYLILLLVYSFLSSYYYILIKKKLMNCSWKTFLWILYISSETD